YETINRRKIKKIPINQFIVLVTSLDVQINIFHKMLINGTQKNIDNDDFIDQKLNNNDLYYLLINLSQVKPEIEENINVNLSASNFTFIQQFKSDMLTVDNIELNRLAMSMLNVYESVARFIKLYSHQPILLKIKEFRLVLDELAFICRFD